MKQYGEDHPVTKALTCFCKCCLWCMENCVRFINRNAYIMTAVYGKKFCSAARRSFSLLARNCVRVLVLDKTTDFILFIGKMVVVGFITIIAFVIFSGTVSEEDLGLDLNYSFVPILLIVLGSYAIASSFFSVYNMAVDTIFLCFLEDIERNDGSAEKPYFMNDDLKKILGFMEQSQKNLKELDQIDG